MTSVSRRSVGVLAAIGLVLSLPSTAAASWDCVNNRGSNQTIYTVGSYVQTAGTNRIKDVTADIDAPPNGVFIDQGVQGAYSVAVIQITPSSGAGDIEFGVRWYRGEGYVGQIFRRVVDGAGTIFANGDDLDQPTYTVDKIFWIDKVGSVVTLYINGLVYETYNLPTDFAATRARAVGMLKSLHTQLPGGARDFEWFNSLQYHDNGTWFFWPSNASILNNMGSVVGVVNPSQAIYIWDKSCSA